MADVNVTTTRDQKPALTLLVRNLPAILSGRLPDEQGIGGGFKSRIGHAILSLVGPNFDQLSQGLPGVDGNKWPPLSKEYLAYGRRFGSGEQSQLKKAAGLDTKNRYGPGKSKGLLTKDQQKLWNRVYAQHLAKFIFRKPWKLAKGHAAAIAWVVVKKAGGKTKLEVFGNRQVQILVDTGHGRRSIQPGTLFEEGPRAIYQKPAGRSGPEQAFEIRPESLIVGTNVKYMGFHHEAKKPSRRRRLWPEQFPSAWWQQILGIAISGLTRIGELYHSGRQV